MSYGPVVHERRDPATITAALARLVDPQSLVLFDGAMGTML